ncbi:hypothetical protein [Halodesulfurarchaeum sp.]
MSRERRAKRVSPNERADEVRELSGRRPLRSAERARRSATQNELLPVPN